MSGWERETLEPRYLTDGTGTRLRYRTGSVGEETTFATIVRYPGTLWRIYLTDGKMLDRPTEAEAVAVVEMMALSR